MISYLKITKAFVHKVYMYFNMDDCLKQFDLCPQAATAVSETDDESNVVIHKDDEVEVVFVHDDGGHQNQAGLFI